MNDIEGIESEIARGCDSQPSVEYCLVVTVLLKDWWKGRVAKQEGKAECWCLGHG
jgi:hypothetical protein